MQRRDFHYDLPTELIAQQPLGERTASRLLCLDGATGVLADRRFSDLPEQLTAGDLVVFNDTRVIPARLFGAKDSGGRVEVLVERTMEDQRVLAHVRASKPPRPGTTLVLGDGIRVEVESRDHDLYVLRFDDRRPVLELLERYGHVPLPPYIRRSDDKLDRDRYQTVYARVPGAVAAPTAGLHFTSELLARLADRGVQSAFVTLHVGAGTFQPVRAERLEDHRMHSERVEVGEQTCQLVHDTRDRGGRVIAVGTTVVRSLEAASASGRAEPFSGATDLFITPGYRFRAVDALVTNFHLPESTLLMLVCAFGGYEAVMAAYRHAVQDCYRFFSYGDAMFVTRAA